MVNQNNYQYGNQGYNNNGMNYNQPQMNRPPIPFNQNNLTRNSIYDIRNDSKRPKIRRLHKENPLINEKRANQSPLIRAIPGHNPLLHPILIDISAPRKHLNEQLPLRQLKQPQPIKPGEFGPTPRLKIIADSRLVE